MESKRDAPGGGDNGGDNGGDKGSGSKKKIKVETDSSSLEEQLKRLLEAKPSLLASAMKKEGYIKKVDLEEDGYIKKVDLEQDGYIKKVDLEDYTKKIDFEKLRSRLDGVVLAMKPAVDYTVFETAIYCFVDARIPESTTPEQRGNIKYSITLFCRSIMDLIFHVEDASELRVDDLEKQRFGLPTDQVLPVLLAGLAGLCCYIDVVGPDVLVAWPLASDRNFNVHNGKLLDNLLGDNSSSKQEYSEENELVAKMRSQIEAKATMFSTNGAAVSGEQAVASVLQEIEGVLRKLFGAPFDSQLNAVMTEIRNNSLLQKYCDFAVIEIRANIQSRTSLG